jgi:hypothetical protein
MPGGMSGKGVRRDKAALSSGCKPHPAIRQLYPTGRLQRSTAEVLSAIYEQDFLACSFGGWPGRGAHHALATLIELTAGRKVGW